MKASAAKPGIGGGLWMAESGVTLPTNASAALASGWTSLGYISDQGVKRKISRSNTVVNAWGGDVVAVLTKGKTETFTFTCIEAANTDVLGITFGEATGELSTGITVKSKADISKVRGYVLSTILADNVHQRIVIPGGVISDIGDIEYKDDGLVAFPLTITAMSDNNGNTAYEYLQTIADSTGTGTGT